MLAGQPNDPQWGDFSDGASEDIREAGDACSFNSEESDHRRGNLPSLWGFRMVVAKRKVGLVDITPRTLANA